MTTVCDDHWGQLRGLIDERGLSGLVARDGERAASNVLATMQRGAESLSTFDPLQFAFFNLFSNALRIFGPRVLMDEEPDENRCVICWLNAKHDRECEGPPCTLPRDGTAFDGWLVKAVDSARRQFERLVAADSAPVACDDPPTRRKESP